ncbi:MAG TPA: YncE family protein [Acidobacteriaceae bacterium]|nr:YncE family protein [Acidobacteriaceae bacterium]
MTHTCRKTSGAFFIRNVFLSALSHVLAPTVLAICGAIYLSGCGGGQHGLGAGISSGAPVQPPLPPPSARVAIASAVNPTTNMVYVVESGSPQSTNNGTLFAVNGASNSIASTLPGLDRPVALDVDSGTNKIYIANGNANTISVVSGTSNTSVATIPVGASPAAVAVDQATHAVYVANSKDGTVSVINGTTNTVTATIPVGVSGLDLIAVDPVLNQIYLASNQGYSEGIAIIDGKSGHLGTTLYLKNTPQALVVDPASHTLYAESNETTVTQVTSSTQIDVIDEVTGAYTSTILVPGFVNSPGFALDSPRSLLYAGNNTSRAIDVINRQRVNTSVPYSPAGSSVNSISVNAATNTVYAVNSTQSGSSVNVQVINGATNTTVSTLKLQ